MQELDTSKVHRNLDAKLKIGGIEALDLLVVLVFSAFMGLFFDGGTMGFVFIFVVPLCALAFLFLIKRNHPEGFLKDFLRFSMSRGFYGASADMKNADQIRQSVSYKANHFHG